MVQGLTFVKSPTTICFLVNSLTFTYSKKKKKIKKKGSEKKTAFDITIYFFSLRARERMLRSDWFLARPVFSYLCHWQR